MHAVVGADQICWARAAAAVFCTSLVAFSPCRPRRAREREKARALYLLYCLLRKTCVYSVVYGYTRAPASPQLTDLGLHTLVLVCSESLESRVRSVECCVFLFLCSNTVRDTVDLYGGPEMNNPERDLDLASSRIWITCLTRSQSTCGAGGSPHLTLRRTGSGTPALKPPLLD